MRLTNLIPIFIFSYILPAGFGQVTEHFTDGNFTSSPTWTGDNTKFTVNAGLELWLNAPAATDVAFLSTPSSAIVNNEWQFYNRMDFNPSSSNFCRFYLVSDQRNFNAPNINGYYVELGRSNDEISLYKQVNGTSTKIIDGPDNMLNAVACTTRVKVIRTGTLWELLVDTTGASTFSSLGTFTDGTISETYFLGAYCKYTATRSNKFFFDDVITVGTNWVDVTNPSIVSYIASGSSLSIQLNEPVLGTDLTSVNFTLDNGLSALTIVEDSLDAKKLLLTASGNFVFDVLYHLNILNLHDFNGNVSGAVVYPFLLHTAVPCDIVINEIMPDPSPPLGLPNAEYIELRNNSIYPLNVDQWSLTVDGTTKTFPSYIIAPGDFVLVADVNDTASFTSTNKKMGIVSFPGLANAGATITLQDTGGLVIDEIHFNLNWYQDAAKNDGGYSIERMNPKDFCLQMDNWRATNNLNGGTPGIENSVYDTTSVPVTVNYFFTDSVHILLVFNQLMNTSGFILPNFSLQNLTAIQTISGDSCLLTLSAPLTVNTPFSLTIMGILQDCSNNSIGSSITIPVVNYAPQLFDMLMDEVMVDESPAVLLPAVEYIEIYNSKSFPVNLAGWILVVNGSSYTLANYILPADSFIVLMDELNTHLFTGINIAGIPGFNTFTNTSGIVELYYSNGELLHAIKYDIGYYDVAGKENGGWSLEMIDNAKPCLRNINWSASQNPSGGTPGRRNSFTSMVEDITKPHALKTGLKGLDTVLIYFDESILPSSFGTNDITLSGGNNALSLMYSSVLLDKYEILLQNPLMVDSIYFLKLNGLQDCEGNMLVVDSLPFSVPVIPSNFDLVINEVLANPTSSCIDYVEIYNRGTHAVDLSGMILGTGDTTSFILSAFATFNSSSVLLHPGEYVFVSEDHEKVMNGYAIPDSTSYWDVTNLPDFANANGVVGLSTLGQQWIDMFAYNDGMHFSGLASTDGVSLERLDVNAPTQNAMNWHSAASTVGYGTPGYRNSEASLGIIISDNFTVDPEVFSPDNDGYKDYTTIYYQLNDPGYVASLKIYDQVGRLEKTLVNNETLGLSGNFVWDGTNDTGGKVNIGIHIIYFELIGSNGTVLVFKKPVVVGTKF